MLTKLQIINAMLQAVGDDPITDPESMYPSAISARTKLDEKDIEMQARGWWFNKDYDLTLVPSVDGEVRLPDTTLAIDLPNDLSTRYVQRGTRIYDKVGHTFKISESLRMNILQRLPLDQLPTLALVYLKAKAVHSFYVDDDGDADKSGNYLRDVNIAWTDLERENLKQKRLNANMRPSVIGISIGIRPSALTVGYNNPMYPGGKP